MNRPTQPRRQATDSRSSTLTRFPAQEVSTAHLGAVLWPTGHTPSGLSDYAHSRNRGGRRVVTLYMGGNTIVVRHNHVITWEG